LREHQHRRPRELRTDLLRGAQPVVGVGGRHAHVDHGDIRLVGADLADQLLGVARLPDNLHPRFLQQAHDALAQQH
jgi:hypothetical protein